MVSVLVAPLSGLLVWSFLEYAEKPVLPQALAFAVRQIMNEDAADRRST